jgi:hypothetical protein
LPLPLAFFFVGPLVVPSFIDLVLKITTMDNKKKWLCYDFPFKLNVQESLLYDLFVLYIFAYCGISYVFASSIDQDSKQHGFEENKQED